MRAGIGGAEFVRNACWDEKLLGKLGVDLTTYE